MRWFAVVAVLLAGCERTLAPQPSMPSPQDAAVGKALYTKHCSICHGETGKGDGYASTYLYPKPRDFTLAQFKIRSTESGNLPTDEDLDRILLNGMPGSAMPSFTALKPEERKAVIDYVKSLAGKLFATRGAAKTIELPPAPAVDNALLARGKFVYRDAGCVKCHGDYGRADGPSSDTLRDNAGMPIRASDFTKGYFKGGSQPSDIMMRFLSGMNGTPMPSFKGQIKDEDMWALAHYVKSLSSGATHTHKSELPIPVKRVTGALKPDPLDAIWKDVAAVEVPMMMLWQRTQSVRTVRTKAVHNGSELAVYVEWDDTTVNGSNLRFQDFSDAIAVMFPSTQNRPNFVMGDKGEPCNIWHWKFDKQLDLAKFFDSQDQYPGMVADDCGPCGRVPNRDHRPNDAAPSHDPKFLTGRGANNPVSQDRRTCVEDLLAAGPGTLTSQKPEEQNVVGKGYWADGAWKVVMIRSLISPDVKDAQFAPGHNHWIAFAVWDGAKGDRDGQKAVCYWQSLQFEK